MYLALKAIHVLSVVLFLGNFIATGVWMAIGGGLPLIGTGWILWSIVLFGISGMAFAVGVAPLQEKLLANLRAGVAGHWNEAEYHTLSRGWQAGESRPPARRSSRYS